MKIDVKALQAKLEELILQQAATALSGEEKMAEVVGQAVAWLDAQVVFHGPLAVVLEAGSDIVIRAVVGIVADLAYGELKKLGRV